MMNRKQLANAIRALSM
ncbi:hypothetical protein, partial [Vibrio fluvialis]